jgi:hypothetical protein
VQRSLRTPEDTEATLSGSAAGRAAVAAESDRGRSG